MQTPNTIPTTNPRTKAQSTYQTTMETVATPPPMVSHPFMDLISLLGHPSEKSQIITTAMANSRDHLLSKGIPLPSKGLLHHSKGLNLPSKDLLLPSEGNHHPSKSLSLHFRVIPILFKGTFSSQGHSSSFKEPSSSFQGHSSSFKEPSSFQGHSSSFKSPSSFQEHSSSFQEPPSSFQGHSDSFQGPSSPSQGTSFRSSLTPFTRTQRDSTQQAEDMEHTRFEDLPPFDSEDSQFKSFF